jgi:hypothetical protein
MNGHVISHGVKVNRKNTGERSWPIIAVSFGKTHMAEKNLAKVK